MQGIYDSYIEFCPEAGGTCLGPICAAFKSTIHLGLDGSILIRQMGYELQTPTPVMLSIDIAICNKYNKLIGEDSANLYYNFLQDMGIIKNIRFLSIGEEEDE